MKRIIIILFVFLQLVACKSNQKSSSNEEQVIKDTIGTLDIVKELTASIDSLSNHKDSLVLKIEKPSKDEYWSIQAGIKEITNFDVFVQLFYNSKSKELFVEDNFSGNKIPLTEWENQYDDSIYAMNGMKLMDYENVGSLKLAMSVTELYKILGKPDEFGIASEWGADGLIHQDLTYKQKGTIINVSYEKPSNQTIFSIKLNKPCNLKTSKGIGIGSSRYDVLKAYKKNIDARNIQYDVIYVGSIYGGIVFNFENNAVSSIFIGAAAE